MSVSLGGGVVLSVWPVEEGGSGLPEEVVWLPWKPDLGTQISALHDLVSFFCCEASSHLFFEAMVL